MKQQTNPETVKEKLKSQAEQPLRNVKDRELWRKLLAFAKPYWKMIFLAFIMTVLIVAANLVQPIIVQVAIDERINGIQQQMVRIDTQSLEEHVPYLEENWNTGEMITWNDDTYIRLGHFEEAELENRPSVGQPTQVFHIDQTYYLIEDWVHTSSTPQVNDENESQLMIDNTTYDAIALDESALEEFRSGDFLGFIYLALFFLLVVVGGAVLHYYQHNTLQFTGQRVIYDIRQKMFRHLTRLQLSFFTKHPVGRLVTRVTHDTEALNQLYSQVIVNMIREILMLAGIIGIMFYYSVELTLITFTVIPVLVIMTFYYRITVRKGHRYVRLVLSHLNAYLAENLSGIRVVQMFTREKEQLRQFDELNEEHYRAGMWTTTINSIFNPAIGFVGNLALALLVWYGGIQVLAGAATFGVVYLFTDYARRFFQPLMALADRYNQIQTAMASSERVFELLEEEPTIQPPAEPKQLPSPTKGKIEFDHVWFSYDDNEWVLKDVDFSVEPGETIAFVGATGAGKSSIIRLINRFFDIQKGSIRIDGLDVRELGVDDLRSKVGVIQQDCFIFTGNVEYNIRLNADHLSKDDVIFAAKSVEMDSFIRRLPDGYDTPLGEQGVTLSSGQQQLLAFLRAMVYDPDILILDEATANIDTETEQVVQRALKQLSKDRTTLIVAHRLSTIQHADKIIVLHKGEIQEVGNHEQLIKQKGLYHRLYEIQNNGKASTIEEDYEALSKYISS